MRAVQGCHGEWNMGSPGGWEYQRLAQVLGKTAWDLISQCVETAVDIDFDHPGINAVPGFARMLLRAHERRHGRNPVHAVLLAETETLDTVLENKNFVDYLNELEGVKASLAGPGHLTVKNGKVCCQGRESTVIFMDFNLNVLVKMARSQDVRPIKEAVRQGILVNPRGMEPIGAKGIFEAITERYRDGLSEETSWHTPWTRQFYARATTGPQGEPVEDLVAWTERNWTSLVLKPAHGYSGHGIFLGYKGGDPKEQIQNVLKAGDYIVQELVPLGLWSERTTWPFLEDESLGLKEWQTDFRCFITDDGLQGFLARFGGVPTNVGSGGGIQPIAVLKSREHPREAVDGINESLFKLGYKAYSQIQAEIDEKAVEMGLTYLLGPIRIMLRPRLLTLGHVAELERYAFNLWHDAVRLEEFWRAGLLDDLVLLGEEERELALSQPWQGSPALMVSDGLFSFGADLMNEER